MMNTEGKIRVAFITLGCKVNKYETDSMKEKLENAGFVIVEPELFADFYIVNTCSVTNMAERKSRQMLRRVRKINPDAVVIAAGCYVNAAHDELLAADYADILVGNNKKKNIVDVITDYMREASLSDYYTEIDKVLEYEEMGCLSKTCLDHQRAYVKIQDGCNQFCSYCIIPYTRGRVRSRKPELIMDEIESLAKEGVNEFVLTGIHISSYGADFSKNTPEQKGDDSAFDRIKDLGSLIEAIAAIPYVKRIRLGSLEPRIITPEFLDKIDSDKLCPHFHLSLQSACNATLKRMNRHYTIEEFEDKCNMIRKHFDRPAITTDVIVGFPGESDEEFDITVANLERLKLYEIHVFKYSVRKGTRAESFPDHVPEEVKNIRSDILLSMTEGQKREYENSLTGFTDEVLIEEKTGLSAKGIPVYTGHTKRYVKVDIESDKDITNSIMPVKL